MKSVEEAIREVVPENERVSLLYLLTVLGMHYSFRDIIYAIDDYHLRGLVSES